MISYLDGKIILKRDKFIILDVAGVGYKVFLNRQTLSRLPEGNRGSSTKSGLSLSDSVKLFIYHDIKEDKSDLYGFLSYQELEFFEVLNDIHGIGPKAALEISVLGPLDKIKDRILAQDEKLFSGIPGIGGKRASSIILELTGKIKMMPKNQPTDEAESALVQLGFSKQKAKEALGSVSPALKSEERIKLALKNLRR